VRLPAALFDLSPCPAFVVRKVPCHPVLLEIDLPDDFTLLGRR